MPVIKKKVRGKKVTWCNQGIKSFTTNPATSLWHQNGINSVLERYILGRAPLSQGRAYWLKHDETREVKSL